MNRGQLGANWVPIGSQLYPNWHTIFRIDHGDTSGCDISSQTPRQRILSIIKNIPHIEIYIPVMESFLWNFVLKEIIRFEKPIFDHFCGNFRFSIVLNSSTKHPFQSNPITYVWRIYRGKGFVWDLIEKDALLASYGRFKMPFCPLSLPNRTPIGLRSYANWGTIGVRLATNWHPIDHHSRLSASIHKGRYYFYFCHKITYVHSMR